MGGAFCSPPPAYLVEDSRWTALDTSAFDLEAYRGDRQFDYRTPQTPDWSFWDWLHRWIARLDHAPDSSFSAWDVITWLLGIAAVGLFIYFLFRIRGRQVVNRDRELSMVEEMQQSSEEQIQDQLERAVAAQDAKLTIRYLLMAGIRHLDEKGLLRYRSDETNTQMLHQLKNHPEWSAFLSEITHHYERTWYGHYELQWPTVEPLSRRFFEMKSSR